MSVWLALRGLAASMPALKALAAAQHPDPLRVALAVTQEVLVAAGAGGAWGNGVSGVLVPTCPRPGHVLYDWRPQGRSTGVLRVGGVAVFTGPFPCPQTSITLLPTLPPVVVLEDEISGAASAAAHHHHHRHRSLAADAAAVLPTLPAGFSPRPPSDVPNLLVPLVFHILLYQ